IMARAKATITPSSRTASDAHSRMPSLPAAERSRPAALAARLIFTGSGSGLDPHITPPAALYLVPRLAAPNQMTAAVVTAIVSACTEGKLWGVFGESTVHVLRVNLMLDGIL
ncbi:MAG: potassium-transporting ATPase subunit C, partial [Oscillospiraceae bacterium]